MAQGGRAAVRMSPDEVAAFLDESMKVQVATVNPDGSPHLTTLFYVMHEGRIAFWTYASSQKIKNLERVEQQPEPHHAARLPRGARGGGGGGQPGA